MIPRKESRHKPRPWPPMSSTTEEPAKWRREKEDRKRPKETEGENERTLEKRGGRHKERGGDRTAVYTLTFDLCITRVRNAESLFFAYPSIFSLCIFPLDYKYLSLRVEKMGSPCRGLLLPAVVSLCLLAPREAYQRGDVVSTLARTQHAGVGAALLSVRSSAHSRPVCLQIRLPANAPIFSARPHGVSDASY